MVTCLERALGSRLWCLTFPLVSGVRCGAWLYRFLIFALSLTFFYLLFVKTHKKFGIKNLWNWHGNRNLMIFDLLTSLQGHQFDPRMKILLAFCSARHPRRFDMPHGHVWFFLTPWAPPAPQSPAAGAWPGRQNENSVWYVLYLSFVGTHAKFGIKISEIGFVIEIKRYLNFWPFPRAPGGGGNAVARPIYVSKPNLVEFRPVV